MPKWKLYKRILAGFIFAFWVVVLLPLARYLSEIRNSPSPMQSAINLATQNVQRLTRAPSQMAQEYQRTATGEKANADVENNEFRVASLDEAYDAEPGIERAITIDDKGISFDVYKKAQYVYVDLREDGTKFVVRDHETDVLTVDNDKNIITHYGSTLDVRGAVKAGGSVGGAGDVLVSQGGKSPPNWKDPTTLTSGDVACEDCIGDTEIADIYVLNAGDSMTGDLTLEGQKDLRLGDGDSSNYVGFQAPATVADDKVWTLPGSDGTTGQVLTTDGAGQLSWSTSSGGGGGAPADATYLTLSANATLSGERVLTAGSGVNITDGGANSTATISSTLGTSIAGSEVDDDTLDFVDFEDTLDLDATTEVNLGANNFDIDLDSTGDFRVLNEGVAFTTFADDGTATFTGTVSAPTLTLTGTGTINGLDAIDSTTETTLEGALDIAGDVSGTGLGAVTIGADKVLESHLKAVDAAADEECLTFESTVGDFEWQSCSVGGSGMASFTLAGSSGTPQTITDGNTVTIAAGSGITTTAGDTDTVTVAATLGTSIAGSEVDDDTLDFVDFEDTMDLDAALVLNQASNTWTQTFSGTTSDGFTYAALGLTTGTAFDVNATNTATTNTAIEQVQFDLTNAQSTLANSDFTGLTVNFTNNPSVAGNTETAVRIRHGVTTNTTDNAVGSLLTLDNADTSATGSTIITDAFRIINSGDIAGGITNAINIDDTDITTDIVLQNDETISNNTDGTIALTASMVTASGDLTITGDDLFLATNTSGFILVADGTNFNPVAMSGDITIDSTGATAIGNDKVTEADLKAVDAAADEECLTYESTVGDFEWQSCATGGTGMTSFTVAGTSGTPQTITDGETLTIAAGSGITTTAGATDTVTIAATLGTSISGSEVDADTLDFSEFKDAMTLDAASTTIEAGAANGITINSTLSAARTTDVLTISQANDATFNNTANLLQLTNADTGSTAAILDISQLAAGTGLRITGSQGLTGVNIGTALDTGTGFSVQSGSVTTGAGFTATGSGSGALSAFTGDHILVNPTRTFSSGTTLTDTGNFLDLTRSNTINLSGGTFTLSGDVATISSNCTQTLGTCTDTSNILSLAQNYASASGAVLDLTNAGTGQGILLTSSSTGVLAQLSASGAATTTADGLLIQQTGGGTLTDAIQIGAGTQAITNAINIASTGVTTDISLQNAETIDNNTDGTITLTAPMVTATGDLTISGDDLFMATNTSGFILVADGTNFNPVAMSGDITIDSTGATAIGNDKVTEADLKAVDAAVDEECLTFESTVGDFEWQSCAAGGMTSFTVAGTSGTPQTITDGNTLTIAAGEGITTTAGATDTVTIAATLGTSISGSEVDPDSLNFTEFSDTLALDASTSITQDGTETFIVSNTGSGVTAIDLTSTGDLEIRDGGTAFVTFSDAGLTTFVNDVDMTFGAGENLAVGVSAAPTGDLVVISNSGFGTTTNGADGLFINFEMATDALTDTNSGLNISLTHSGETDDTGRGINISTTGIAAGTLYGLNVAGITGGNGTEKAIVVGSGWDTGVDISTAATGMNITSTGTTSDAATISATSLTTGDALQIAVDTDTLTTGKAVRVQGTSTGTSDIFTVDGAGHTALAGNLNTMSNATKTTTSRTTSLADNAADVGYFTSIAIGTDGFPVIAYYDLTVGNLDLKVTKCGNAACSSGNITTTVDSTGDVGQYASIAIGTDGFPVISYFDETGDDLEFVKCGNAACSSGNTLTTVDSTGHVGTYNSLAIGTDGLPVISYYDDTNKDLKVAKCGNVTCSSGNTLTAVDTTGTFGHVYTSVAIGTDGLPVISYMDNTNSDLKVAKCGNAACSSGNTLTTVDSSGLAGRFSSIAIGGDGLPVISHYEANNSLLSVAKCGNAACSSGNTLTTVDNTADVGQFNSITIGSDGFPIISYYDAGPAFDLKVAKCGNAACSSGNTLTTVDSTDQVGEYTSIAILPDGFPIISYRDFTNTALKTVRCVDLTCASTSADIYTGGQLAGAWKGNERSYVPVFETVSTFEIANPSSFRNTSFLVNGAEHMTITPGGLVGIGTTTPTGKLTVKQDAAASIGIDVQIAQDQQAIKLTDQTNTDSIGQYVGSGSPEGVVTAQLGSIYFDHAGGDLYLKGTGDGTNTGWEELSSDQAHMARMTRDVAQSIPNITATKIAFDAEDYDVGGIADPVTNDLFTISRAGKYLITASWESTGATNNIVAVYIYKNGVEQRVSYVRLPSASSVEIVVSDVLNLAVNDTIEMYVFQSSGAALNTATGLGRKPAMAVAELSTTTRGADLAEIYFSEDILLPGTVVALDPSRPGGVRATSGAYDPNTLGIVSTKPGIILGDTDVDNSGIPVYVGLSGRVPVKVSTESGPIQPGDLLVASSKPGVAMKATKPGPIVGQALEAYDRPEAGLIKAFIKNAYVSADVLAAMSATTTAASVAPDTANVVATAEGLEVMNIATLEALAEEVPLPVPAVAGTQDSAPAETVISPELAQNTMLIMNKDFTMRGKVRIEAEATITGTLLVDMITVSRLLTVGGNTTLLGDLEIKGELSLSNQQSGFATIPRGGKEVEVKYPKAFAKAPLVQVTPQGLAGHYWVSKQTPTGFIITLAELTPQDVTFNWVTLTVEAPQTVTGQAVDTDGDGIPDIDEVKDQPEPLVTPTPLVTPEVTPEPTATPAPTPEVTPSPSVTPEPTATPTPTLPPAF
jgi:hypothetical protein